MVSSASCSSAGLASHKPFSLLVTVLAIASASAKVHKLNEKTFEVAISGTGHALVFFYAPWCEHCKELKPEFEKAARIAKKTDDSIIFAKVDATKEIELAKKYGVDGYPSLRFFKENEKLPVNGEQAGRTAEELAAWAIKVAQAPDRVTEITSGVGINNFIEEMKTTNSVGVIGTFEDTEAADMFVGVAEKFKFPVRFAWTTKNYAWKHLDLEEGETNLAIMYKPYDEQRVVRELNDTKAHSKKSQKEMADMMNKMMGVPLNEAEKLLPEPKPAKELGKWVSDQMMPLVVPFTDQFMNLIFTGPVQVHMIVIVDPQNVDPDLEDDLKEVALEQRGEVLHILMPAVEETEEMRKFFGVDDRVLPTALISDMRDVTDENPAGSQYLWDETKSLTARTVSKFEKDFLAGSLTKGKKKKKSKKKKSPSASQEL